MTRAKPGLVVNFGLLLVVAWALVVAASEPSARELYFECCARCHGETGEGNGPYADELPNRPRNFTDCKTMDALPDDVLFKAIKKGGPAVGLPDSMPSWEAALDDDQIHELIHYVRHFCDGRRSAVLEWPPKTPAGVSDGTASGGVSNGS